MAILYTCILGCVPYGKEENDLLTIVLNKNTFEQPRYKPDKNVRKIY